MFQIDRGNLIMMFKRHKSQKKIDVMEDIDSVPSKCPICASRSFIVCV